MQLPNSTVLIVVCDSLLALTVAVMDSAGASVSSPPDLSTLVGKVQFSSSYFSVLTIFFPGPCELMGTVSVTVVQDRISAPDVLTSLAEVPAAKLHTISFAVVPAGLVISSAEAVPADRAIKEAAATAARLKVFRYFMCSSLFRCSRTGLQ